MKLFDILQGKWLGHPLHPALVHLPIGLWTAATVLDVVAWLGLTAGVPARLALAAVVLGLLAALLAVPTGVADWAPVKKEKPAWKLGLYHMLLNLLALGLFALGAGLRYEGLDAPRTAFLPLIISAIGVGLITFSGYLGGHLVYDDVIGVGRHRRRTRTPESTITLHAPPGEKVMIADAAALGVGETLRIDAAGTIVTVARGDEGVFAFQEYCPHRYGPLSEGRIEGCEVMCPWHGSRFDLRDGRVTQGPAKINLRCFRVEIRDGKLWLEMPGQA